jgi:BirA family biotin operon repressor/biotin-[acetyl-CoA-carboxylase] ligase
VGTPRGLFRQRGQDDPRIHTKDHVVSCVQSRALIEKHVPDLESKILRFDSLPSTNAEAARRAVKGAAEGLCVVASEQTAGRGRLDRHWVSRKDAGLYCSIILRPQFNQGLWPLLTLMVAVAVHDMLLDICAVETDIKWPNDILASDKKLCGILAETVETPIGRAVVLGIGINLRKDSFPVELNGVATSVEAAAGRVPDSPLVLERLLDLLASHYETIQQPGGAEAIVQEWSTRSSYAHGKQIRVANGEEILEGTTRGLEPDGTLRVETDTGEIKRVRAGDVIAVRTIASLE